MGRINKLDADNFCVFGRALMLEIIKNTIQSSLYRITIECISQLARKLAGKLDGFNLP